jgi:hypothetical protein
LYRYGLPRGVLGSQARLVGVVSTSTENIELEGHGFETDDRVTFRAAEGGSMAAPLVAGVEYFAIRVNDSFFQVSATQGGLSVNLTSSGTSMMVSSALPFDEVIEFYSRWADGFFYANAVPFTPGAVPAIVKGLVAQLAAKKILQLAGHTSETVDEFETAAMAQLERFAKGLPVRDVSATAATNKSVVSTLVSRGVDRRGWGSGGLP